MPPPSSLRELVDRWSTAKPAERANAQSYLIELSHALGVEPPRPAGSGYEFEYSVKIVNRDGTETTNFIDLYKANHFALEAKDEAERSTDLLLRKAFGQVRSYVGHLPHERPPYLLVLDVGKTLLVWDRWSGDYGGFNAARRIDLRTLPDRPEDADFLRDVWTNPTARDPRSTAIAVTKDIAAKLANLAVELEEQGYEHERVARFIMRCVFTMFAEDVGLLPGEPFRRIIDEAALENPQEFVPLAEELWRAMDKGERFLLKKLLRFNGHFFREAEALPLDRKALTFLLSAAEADWQHVEPTIFGTLLTRALDPVKRHRLGAEYTPREFVERIVRPTVEEPIRERWTAVQAEVLQLKETGKTRGKVEAEQRLRDFHAWLRGLRFLDPACGSGNFLYVTMHLVKRIELEVIRELEGITGTHEIRLAEVGPWQFYGIEVDAWPREIAELTLWIGFHSFWKQHHDVQPPEPILQDTGTLELKDAVLAWDELVHVPERDRPDPTPRLTDPVTGRLIPDPAAKLPYVEHMGATPAKWPRADFIVGNPPYLGQFRQREAFGDGYVDALRKAYPEVPQTADYVMYWWHRAAEAVAAGEIIRAGLITTNSVSQAQNRSIIAAAAEKGAEITWAIADHVWYDGEDGAEVRVAMTVIAKDPPEARLISVKKVERVAGEVPVVGEVRVSRLNADLTAHADVAGASKHPLLTNAGLSSPGLKLHGSGFILSDVEATTLLAQDEALRNVIRPYRNGKDLTARQRGVWLIDFGLRDEADARRYSVAYNIVRDRVKPERDANQRDSYRTYWWRFGEPRREWRAASTGLSRYIATVETSKHRFFVFLDAEIAPDNSVIAIASDDAYILGVLSSRIHLEWALAAGGRMGVRDTPRYNKGLCFDPFPFAKPSGQIRLRVADAAMRLEAHRNKALAANESVTMMKMYDVVDALRAGRPLKASEQVIHVAAACGVLKDLHDELDALVAEAYGWSWPMQREEILDRLVALHDEQARDENRGIVRWLRPEYQGPRFGRGVALTDDGLGLEDATPEQEHELWPTSVIEQIQALQRLLVREPCTEEGAIARFRGARSDLVSRHLETLALMGEIQRTPDGRYQAVRDAA